MSSPRFVHLNVHSQFSLIDSLLSVKDLIAEAKQSSMPALAITDQMNFFGLVKYYKAAINAGIKPLIGCDVVIQTEENVTATVTLLAMSDKGYRNIIELISKAYLEGQVLGEPLVKWPWFAEKSSDIIVLSGAIKGDIGQAIVNGNNDNAAQYLKRWQALLGDRFYIELQRIGHKLEKTYELTALNLAAEMACPLVATNAVRFAVANDFEAHEARVCINESSVLNDRRREKKYTDQQYFKTPEEMVSLFNDLPSAIENSIEIAKRCNVQLNLGKYYLPEYPIPEGLTQDTFFRKICREGLDERLQFLFDINDDNFPEIKQNYQQRLEFELDIILAMGFPGYFLIVMDFIQWAKENDVPVGPGRGSGAGSLVAYVLKITDLDPIEYDLLFERFLNPERVSMPDFDIDFCMEGRDKVINYVAEHYGRDAVSQIITFGTMAAKAVVRDVARVQGKSYSLADKLSKMIPFEIGMTLKKAFEQEEPLQDFLNADTDAAEIWQMAEKLEGTIRGVGKHAGGVVIAPTKLTDFSAIYCDEEGGGLVTQFDKGDVEDAGLVKFDFLGLRTLTIIDWAVKAINTIQAENNSPLVDMTQIPLDDKLTFDLLKRAETTAVFQLESRGMKDLIKRLQPDNIEDMIALVALFRPGPLDSGMVDDFVNRKHGRAEVAYPDARYQHEWLKPILEPTYGVIVYQEQVMQIAQVLAGYSLGGADLLRRAMGKKKPEEMAKQRSIFEEGAKSKGVEADLAMKIFDLVEKFAGYGFNKSHSAAYALVSYQTAWLKAHYPAPFMAAVLSSELQNTDKIVTLIDECRQMGLVLANPDVNQGQYMFTVGSEGQIIYGLGAIKGLGEGPVESLILARKQGGNFKDLFDFCNRTDPRKMNKRSLEALIKAGAFDLLAVPRHIVFAALPEAVKAAEQQANNADAGMEDLFGVLDASQDENPYAYFLNETPWIGKMRLAYEKETLGLFLTGHPIDDYEDELKTLKIKRLNQVVADKKKQWVCGMLVAIRYVKTKRGDKMAILTLDDRTGRIEATIFAKLLPEVQEKLIIDEIVFISGEIEHDEYSGQLRLRALELMTIAEQRENRCNECIVEVNEKLWPSQQKAFITLVEQHASAQGDEAQGSLLVLHYKTDKAECLIRLAPQYRIPLEDKLLLVLKKIFGEDSLRFQ